MKNYNNSRTISRNIVDIPDNEKYSICFTKSGGSGNNQIIKCVLMDNEIGEKVESEAVYKFESCSKVSEGDYKPYISSKADVIAEELFKKLANISPKTAAKNFPNYKEYKRVIYSEYYEKVHTKIETQYCWAPSTIIQYYNTVKNTLAPHLNEKYMYQLTIKDYEDAVEFVKLDYMFKNGKLLSQERIDQYWGNLYCVADFAFHSSVCPENPISKRKVLNPINKAIDERQKRRSINTRETSQLMSLLAEDFDKCNTTLGTALQMFLGLRTAEACGPNFRDVLNFYDSSGRCYISSYTQNRSNVGKEYNKFSGQKKSVNGYRYIPVPKQLQYLIERKREKLFELGFTESEISSMPLVSEDVSNVKDLEQARTKAKIRCDSSKLGIAGGRRLYSVLKTRANVEIPCEDDSLLAEDPSDEENNALKKIWNEIESDSQSYVLRRNFATYLFGICGLTTAEVQYLMGHKQDNNKGCVAIDFTAESILRKIQNKMDRLICFPDIDAEGKGDFFEKLSISNPKEILQRINCAPNSTVQTEINDDVECCFSFVPDSSESSIEITIVLQAAEPMDELKIEFQSEDELTYLAVASDAVSTSPAETANVLSYYYDDIFSVSVEAEPNKVDCSVESSGDQGIDNDFLDYEAAVENQIEYYEKNVDIAKDEPEDKDNIDGDENDEEN